MLKLSDYIYRFFLFGLSFSLMVVMTGQVLKGKLNLVPKDLSRVNNLRTYVDRFQFVSLYLSVPLLLLSLQILFTIWKRIDLGKIDPKFEDENEDDWYLTSMLLRNITEQFVIAALSQIVLITFLTPRQTAQFIPLLSLFFVIGRITFNLGYVRSRAFGIFLNALPAFLTCLFSAFKFSAYEEIFSKLELLELESAMNSLLSNLMIKVSI